MLQAGIGQPDVVAEGLLHALDVIKPGRVPVEGVHVVGGGREGLAHGRGPGAPAHPQEGGRGGPGGAGFTGAAQGGEGGEGEEA
ncbi:MAG TPA: hypothetical protein DCQ25_01390 [Elusimicrobia bacterium]|nr:hypothetical protein [Elusimicrobiota bacterium]